MSEDKKKSRDAASKDAVSKEEQEERRFRHTVNVYETLCKMLDDSGIKYTTNKEDFSVRFFFEGEKNELLMEFDIKADEERELLTLTSPVSVIFPREKRIEAATVITFLNYYWIRDGFFDYNSRSGLCAFRITAPYMNCEISKDVCSYLFQAAHLTLSETKEKLYKYSKGLLSAEQICVKP